jgi:hypothetical protein
MAPTGRGARSLQGLEAVLSVEGATNGAGLRAAIEQGLGPPVVPGDVGIVDKLGAPNAAGRREAIANHGAQHVKRIFLSILDIFLVSWQ